MKSMMLTGIREMRMFDIPEPVITNPGDVKIRMSVVGVCGSDVHYYLKGKIGSQIVEYPFPVGHEGAGVVEEIGRSVSRVKKGDLVAIEPAVSCGKCDQCVSGRPNTCRKLLFLGCPGQAEGCLSEYVVLPQECCFPLSGNLTADHGVISEPFAIGLYSVKTSVPMKSKKAGILGFGPIGMSVMIAARSQEAGAVYVTDKVEERLKIASKEGAVYVGNPLKRNIVKEILEKESLGLDVVFECCGQQEAVEQAIDLLKPGGKLMIAGIPEFDTWKINVDKTRRKEITIQFVRRQADCTLEALEMIRSGRADVSNMVTHRFSFEKSSEAFELVSAYSDGVMKAMIDFS